jgi:hypothetical protein
MTPEPVRARSIRHARGHRDVALAILAFGLLVAGTLPTGALGASAAPSAAPNATGVQFWLDEPLTPDAPAGGTLSVGFTLWDTRTATLSEVNDPYVKLHPKSGKAKPTSAESHSDWPGHVTAEVTVPKGGVGALDIGFDARECTADGTCKEIDLPFEYGGVGPPPDAPRSLLVDARFEHIAEPITAGEPADIVVVVQPRVAWDPAALDLPEHVVAMANGRAGSATSATDLPSVGQQDGALMYGGQITIAESGTFTLQVAIPVNGSEDQVVRGTSTRVTVAGTSPDRSATTASPAASTVPSGDGIPWLLVGGVVLAVAAGFVIRRVFADL